MVKSSLEIILKKIQSGKIEVGEAVEELKTLPFSDLGFAKPDHHRELRKGFPEVILGLGKTPSQVGKIAASLLKKTEENILISQANRQIYQAVKKTFPKVKYFSQAKLIVLKQKGERKRGQVLVVTAGTADLAVAEEAAITAETMGAKVTRLYDAGIAGLHRLLASQKKLFQARVVVAIAGMEGALPSFIAGLVSAPVIAVPTSIGYGTGLGGLAALSTMLNSCPPGIAVVNIDNGFGAGYMAAIINQMGEANQL